MERDVITVLNYPGSKKRLLDFINETVESLLPEGKTVFDIFAGTSSVGYSLKSRYKVMANDAEVYCYEIARALLVNNERINFELIKSDFIKLVNGNICLLQETYPEVSEEEQLILDENVDGLVEFNYKLKNIWQEGYVERKCSSKYKLFTTYYSNSYFGLKQAMEIDSIRYAIEHYKNTKLYDALLVSLYFAMKENVFSKDGHMAQPLNVSDKRSILIKRRKGSILEKFFKKIQDFESEEFVVNNFDNKAFNKTLDEILGSKVILEADLIYADPPYTDMQYSRYFHLLETLTKYDYPNISTYRGKVSTGLYREYRFQSPLSQRGKAKRDLEKLIEYCANNNKIIVFSYAYPVDLEKEKSDRYTMSIEDLKSLFFKHYGEKNTLVLAENFSHCNNQNSEAKKVYEYLIVGKNK